MLSLAFLLCGVIVISFMFLFMGWDKVRIIAGSLMTVSGIVLIPLFYKIQRMNGNPDSGKEFEQLYMPLTIFAVSALIGIIVTIIYVRKCIRKKREG